MSHASPKTLRIFSALELPPAVLGQLTEMMAALKKAAPPGSVRWVRPEGIHLTFVFYGDTEASRILALQAMLAQAAGTVEPFSLQMGGLGAFPNPQRPRVVWAGVRGDLESLRKLQRAVEAGSQALGFQPDKRGFNPHLTLGRVNQPQRPADQMALSRMMAQARVPAGGDFRLERLRLYRSELTPGGAVYTPIFTAPLGSRNA